MSSDRKLVFTKENIDKYLNELAKEYRKQGGRYVPAELILIGGASVLINHGFRDMTTDIDAVIKRVSYTLSEGINIAMEKNNVACGA